MSRLRLKSSVATVVQCCCWLLLEGTFTAPIGLEGAKSTMYVLGWVPRYVPTGYIPGSKHSKCSSVGTEVGLRVRRVGGGACQNSRRNHVTLNSMMFPLEDASRDKKALHGQISSCEVGKV
jgi:hypothetical protein